jgi:hypothetical protein
MAYFLEFMCPVELIRFKSFKEEVETEEKFNRNRHSGGVDWTAGVPYYKLSARCMECKTNFRVALLYAAITTTASGWAPINFFFTR